MVLVPLAPAPGLNSDDTTFSAQGRWADGNNVRFHENKPQVIGGWGSALFTASAAVCEMTVVQSSAGTIYIAYGCGAKLYVGVGLAAPADKTPVGLPVGNASWSFSQYGSTLMASPFNGSLYQHTLGGGVATLVTQAPAQIRCMLTTPQRQVLAFGCNEEISTTFNGRCIRGSDLEDPTDWTTTSTNNAFEDILDDTGTILAARFVGDYIAVWTSTSLWMGTFIGDPSQVYRWERIADVGITGVNAACVSGLTAYWMSNDLKVYAWSPGVAPAAVPCPIAKAFSDSIQGTDFLRLFVVPHYNEVWVLYDRTGSGAPTNYIAFNPQGQWFRGVLGRDAVCSNGLATLLVQGVNGQAAKAGFLAAQGTSIYMHEIPPASSPAAMTWSITSADQYLDNGKRRVQIQRFVPDFEDQAGDIALTLYMRNFPQSTAVTKGPYTVTNTATKKDFRASGMIVDAKFSGTTYARFGTPCFETVPMGER